MLARPLRFLGRLCCCDVELLGPAFCCANYGYGAPGLPERRAPGWRFADRRVKGHRERGGARSELRRPGHLGRAAVHARRPRGLRPRPHGSGQSSLGTCLETEATAVAIQQCGVGLSELVHCHARTPDLTVKVKRASPPARSSLHHGSSGSSASESAPPPEERSRLTDREARPGSVVCSARKFSAAGNVRSCPPTVVQHQSTGPARWSCEPWSAEHATLPGRFRRIRSEKSPVEPRSTAKRSRRSLSSRPRCA